MRLSEEKQMMILGILLLIVAVLSMLIQMTHNKMDSYQQNISLKQNELIAIQNFHIDAVVGAMRLELWELSGVDIESLKKDSSLFDKGFFIEKADYNEKLYSINKKEYLKTLEIKPKCIFKTCERTITWLSSIQFIIIGISVIMYLKIYESISMRLKK